MYSARFRSPLMAFAFVLLAVVLVVPTASAATTVEVGSCQTGLVQFTTIQAAVNQSPDNTTIDVCPGTYPEQVSITHPVTLKGVADPNSTADAAIIVPPPGGLVQNATSLSSGTPIAAQILVQNLTANHPVSLINLTVDGANNNISGCAPELIGIFYQNASGTVNTSAVRNEMLAPALNGCQSGLGIFVQSGNSLTSNVTVENSSIHTYQKNGITGDEVGTTLTVNNSFVQGLGVVNPPAAAQNGIQIGFGAIGSVHGNTVIDQVYGDPVTAASAGILLYDAQTNSGITVSSNNVGNTQIGIGLYTDDSDPTQYDDGVTVSSNRIYETLNYDAIDACTNGNHINGNIILNSAESAIHLDSFCSGNGNNTGTGNTVGGNNVLESACAGVLQETNSNNINATSNHYFDVPQTVLTGSCPAGPRKPPAKHGHFRPVR